MFLLQYISDQALLLQITACINVVEGFNQFTHWLFFGKDGVITENDLFDNPLTPNPDLIVRVNLF